MIRKPRSIKKTIKVSKFSLLLGVLILLIFLFLPGQNIYETSWQISRPAVAESPLNLKPPTAYPINLTKNLPPELTSQAVLVMDLPSSVILYEKNPHQRLFPASITKVMTALVALDFYAQKSSAYKLDQLLEVKTSITDGKVMGLTVGEKLTFENLLYAALVDSANDAAYAIADNFPGGVEKFVVKMNEKAKELSMTDTNFTNPIGFEDDQHYSTASDLSRLASSALQNPVIAQVVGTAQITVPNSDFSKFYNLQNVNELLGKVPGVLGLKTGWTDQAGECLVTAITRNNHQVLFIVLGSKDRFGETEKLIDWVFGNFSWQVMALPKSDQ